jgi:hypothetical protein
MADTLFIEVKSAEKPELTGWYWSANWMAFGLGNGPFATKDEAVAHYEKARGPRLSVEKRGYNRCLLVEGSLIATRDDTSPFPTWIMVEPGWHVRDVDGRKIEVTYRTADVVPFAEVRT